MKKLFICLSVVFLFSITLTGCNKQIIDTNYTFNRAIISLPDGTLVNGEVQSWCDYDDGDQIQVKVDDIIYLVHSSDIVLISDK